jgi:hypothetical protein
MTGPCCGHARCQPLRTPNTETCGTTGLPVEQCSRPAGAPDDPDSLHALLKWSAKQPSNGTVWVMGGWVTRTPSVPIDGGVAAIVRYAEDYSRANLKLQLAAHTASRKLDTAEAALRHHASIFDLNADVSIALEAVERAKETLG